MPITNETIVEANRKMLGKTNRAILFAKVNMDEVLNPDEPEEEQEPTPSLKSMLPRVNESSNDQFLSGVRDKLTVTNFNEFLKKFQPGFYYQVSVTPSPTPKIPVDAGVDTEAATSLFGKESGGAQPIREAQLKFSLEGGFGWKKVRITADHPYIACLSKLFKQRVRQDVSTFRVDVDASQFTFKPKNRRALLQRLAVEVQGKYDHLLLEASRHLTSTETATALEAYERAKNAYCDTFARGLEDSAQLLPTILYELEQPAEEQTAHGAVESGEEIALLKSEAKPAGTPPAMDPLELALDKIREAAQKVASPDLPTAPQAKRFTMGRFMDQTIRCGRIQPLLSSMVAAELQQPKAPEMLSRNTRDVELFHDKFLDVYNSAVEDFLKTVTPLFETIMGVYFLFNEFPSDVKLAEGMKPELVIANADLPDLMLPREAELRGYLEMACAQANNQFRDAISFVIVPNVAEFRKKRPRQRADSIMMDDPLVAEIKAAQSTATGADEESYGRVTFVDEMLLMMDWGLQYGFQVLFSPEEHVRASEASRDFYQDLTAAYAVESVVEHEAGECAVLCVPDFIIMPLDGTLVTSKTADGQVGVDVPELNVRSCYVTCGRLMANDVPAYLQRKLLKAKIDPTSVRMDISGIGVDLGLNRFLGETNLPTDHFLYDSSLGDLLTPEMPFAVFTHFSGRSPVLSETRTMRRLTDADGNPYYRSLHLFRQQIYLNRLLRAAHELGYGGAFPSDDREAVIQLSGFIDYILKFTAWYNPKMVNSFPSKLNDTKQYTVSRQKGNSFKIALGFEQGLISEFGIHFGAKD